MYYVLGVWELVECMFVVFLNFSLLLFQTYLTVGGVLDIKAPSFSIDRWLALWLFMYLEWSLIRVSLTCFLEKLLAISFFLHLFGLCISVSLCFLYITFLNLFEPLLIAIVKSYTYCRGYFFFVVMISKLYHHRSCLIPHNV